MLCVIIILLLYLTASRQIVFFHDVVQSAKKNLIYLKCMFDAVKSQ